MEMSIATVLAAGIMLVICGFFALGWAQHQPNRIELSRVIVVSWWTIAMLYVAASTMGPTLPQRIFSGMWLAAALVTITFTFVPRLRRLRRGTTSSPRR
jgi:hypothetical protein